MEHWLACKDCRVGASNRQTRFLAGTDTTGDLGSNDEAMLQVAMANLRTCAFIGLMENYQDSMLVLKYTFPSGLSRLRSYSTSAHPKNKNQRVISDEQKERIRQENILDIQLYDLARQLFDVSEIVPCFDVPACLFACLPARDSAPEFRSVQFLPCPLIRYLLLRHASSPC